MIMQLKEAGTDSKLLPSPLAEGRMLPNRVQAFSPVHPSGVTEASAKAKHLASSQHSVQQLATVGGQQSPAKRARLGVVECSSVFLWWHPRPGGLVYW